MKQISDRKSFNAEIAEGGRFALFYSGYCPFCLSFLPDFEKLAAAAPAAFLKVCTDDLPELEDLFSIEVVPTVLYFKGGKLSARLDGVLGLGLTAGQLAAFAGKCGLAAGKNPH
jgi:thiol-disulfide isomerase/thioredoxin